MKSMKGFRGDEIAAMSSLQQDMADLIAKAVEGGMMREHAVHVVGSVALACMRRMPDTDDGAAVLHSFVTQVSDLMGEASSRVRH